MCFEYEKKICSLLKKVQELKVHAAIYPGTPVSNYCDVEAGLNSKIKINSLNFNSLNNYLHLISRLINKHRFD